MPALDALPMLAMNGKQHVGGIPSPLSTAGGCLPPPGRYSPTYRPDGMRRMGNVSVCTTVFSCSAGLQIVDFPLTAASA